MRTRRDPTRVSRADGGLPMGDTRMIDETIGDTPAPAIDSSGVVYLRPKRRPMLLISVAGWSSRRSAWRR